MKSKLTCAILIAVGFAIPFVLQKIYPTFLFASVVSLLCFWIGFILILSPIDKKAEINPCLKWARYAILFHIAWTIFFTGYMYLIYYSESLKWIGHYTLSFFGFFTNPIGKILDAIVPEPITQLPNGSVLITQSIARGLATTFFSLILYSFVGFYLKYIKDRKITLQSRGTARTGPLK